jgi:hypothetical protein
LPQPIKALQSIPIALSYVFKEVAAGEIEINKAIKDFGKGIAADVPGYSNIDDGIADDVAVEDSSRLQPDIEQHSLDLCTLIDEDAQKAIRRGSIRGRNTLPERELGVDAVHRSNDSLVKGECFSR